MTTVDLPRLPRPARHGPRRRFPRLTILLRITGLVIVVAAAMSAVSIVRLMTQTLQRTLPSTAGAIRDQGRFVAAAVDLDTVVDLSRGNFFSGRHIEMQVFATVDYFVDFAAIDERDITISLDRDGVTVVVPAPQMDRPNIDTSETELRENGKGLVQKVGDFFTSDKSLETEAYGIAEDQLVAAAAASGARARAQENTRAFLTRLLRAVGFTTVTVLFGAPPA